MKTSTSLANRGIEPSSQPRSPRDVVTDEAAHAWPRANEQLDEVAADEAAGPVTSTERPLQYALPPNRGHSPGP